MSELASESPMRRESAPHGFANESFAQRDLTPGFASKPLAQRQVPSESTGGAHRRASEPSAQWELAREAARHRAHASGQDDVSKWSPSADDEEAWFDEAAGPLVRPYAVTGGRTRSDTVGLDLITLVVAVRESANHLEPESLRILQVCQQPISVAEVAAKVDLPLQVVKVLLSDLITQNLMIYRSAMQQTEAPSQQVLQAVLDGIRKL